jgi:HK97 family phage major capsid protein
MKKDLKKLRQNLADKKKAGLAKTEELNALLAKGELSADDQAKMTALDAEVTALEGEVTQMASDIEIEERAARRSSIFLPANSGFRSSEPNPSTTDGFRSLAEFAVAVRNAQVNHTIDTRLAAPSNFHQNQGAAGEGYLVPTDYRTAIWELAFDGSDLLGMVTPEPTSSNAISMPKDETTPWGASGVQAYWRAEAAQMTASKAAINQTMLQLHELYAFVLASQEVLDDAPRLQDKLTRQAARAIRWQASDAIMWGDGNGKPLGFQKAASLVTVAKESGQAASTVAIANLLKMASRLLRTGGSPLWIINADTIPQIGALTLGNVPAWLPSQQPIQASPFNGSLCGYPVLFSEHAQSLTTLGDLNLVDLDGYFCATKAGGGIDFASSIHLFFDYGLQAFRWTFRMGGQPYLSAAVSPAHGSNTKSHFVTLQAR